MIAVLMGGYSAEREISLLSGKAVYDAFCKSKVNCFAFDLTQDNLDDALWTIAEECREWKKMGHFTNWRSAYRHGAMQLTKIGKEKKLI